MAQCGGERRGARRFEDSEEHCCCSCTRHAAQESAAWRSALLAATRCYEVHQMMRSALPLLRASDALRVPLGSPTTHHLQRAESRAQRQRQRQQQNRRPSTRDVGARRQRAVAYARAPLHIILIFRCARTTWSSTVPEARNALRRTRVRSAEAVGARALGWRTVQRWRWR